VYVFSFADVPKYPDVLDSKGLGNVTVEDTRLTNNYAPPNAPVALISHAQIKPKLALIAFVIFLTIFAGVLGFMEARGIPEPQAMQVLSSIAFSALTFWWFWLDSEARAYRRSPFLSIGIIVLGLLVVPYYLVRSRSKGTRLAALGKLIAFVLIAAGGLVVGGMSGAWLGQMV
jgi:hypothetical protein